MRMFFNWFYWAINFGSFIAIGVVAYLLQYCNFFLRFLVPGIALVLATVVFVLGRAFYLSKKPMGSVLTNTRRIIAEAFGRRKERKRMYTRQDRLVYLNHWPKFLKVGWISHYVFPIRNELPIFHTFSHYESGLAFYPWLIWMESVF